MEAASYRSCYRRKEKAFAGSEGACFDERYSEGGVGRKKKIIKQGGAHHGPSDEQIEFVDLHIVDSVANLDANQSLELPTVDNFEDLYDDSLSLLLDASDAPVLDTLGLMQSMLHNYRLCCSPFAFLQKCPSG